MARNALLGIRKGYRNHLQLERFKRKEDPVVSIDTYLCLWRVKKKEL